MLVKEGLTLIKKIIVHCASIHLLALAGCILLPVSAMSQKEITLQDCRELALENNRNLRIAQEHYFAAQSMRKASFTHFLPSFDFAAQYLRTNKPFNLLSQDAFLPIVPFDVIDFQSGTINPAELIFADPSPLVFGPDGMPLTDPDGNFVFQQYAWLPQSEAEMGQKNNLLMHFNLRQPIFTGGKIRAQYHAARQMENIARSHQKLSETELLSECESLFWQLITLQEKEQLAQKYIKMLQSLVTDLENYHEEGIVQRNDVLRAQIKLNEARLEKSMALNGIARITMALNRILGLPLTGELVAKEEPGEIVTDYVLADLWQQGKSNRPELEIAKGKTELAGAMQRMAKASLYPDIALGAGYFAVNPNPYSGLESGFGHDWVAGITLTMPVYHWGERRHLHNAARHEKNVQKHRLKDAFEMIQMDITNAFYNYTEARETLKINELSLEQAEENMNITRDNFEVGMVNTSTLLEAQTLWQQAHTDLIEAKSELRIRHSELEKAAADK